MSAIAIGTARCTGCHAAFTTRHLLRSAEGWVCDACHAEGEASAALVAARRRGVLAQLVAPVPGLLVFALMARVVSAELPGYISYKSAGGWTLIAVFGGIVAWMAVFAGLQAFREGRPIGDAPAALDLQLAGVWAAGAGLLGVAGIGLCWAVPFGWV